MAADPTWGGVARGMLVLAALWWAWAAYAWVATATDLSEGPTRLATIVVMAVMLGVGLAVPGAFGDEAALFAVLYAIVRVLHLVVYALAVRDEPRLLRSVVALAPTSVLASAMILTAAWYSGPTELLFWSFALLIDYAAPAVVGADGWRIDAHHFAERFALIFIIALGESLIAIGVGAEGLDVTAGLVGLASIGVFVVASLWWLHFDIVAVVAERRFASLQGAAQAALARDSYSYLHLPMVAGVLLFALGVKKTMAHPEDPLSTVGSAALAGGIALFLAAHVLFRLRNVRTFSRHRVVTLLVLVALAIAGPSMPAAALLLVVALVCGALVAWETIRFREARTAARAGSYIPRRHREAATD